MPLPDLLMAGAEAVAMGLIADIPWTTDSQGRQQRRGIRQSEFQAISNRMSRRLGRPLSGQELSQLRRVVDAADNASRRAHQLGGDGRRLPRPSEIDRLPGTGDRGGDSYTYTVAVSIRNTTTGAERTFTLVVRDPGIMSSEEVVARAEEMIARGDVLNRMGSDVPDLNRVVIQGITVISVYQGFPEIR